MCFGGKSAQSIYEETKPPTPPLPSLSIDSAESPPPQYKDVPKPTKRKGMTQRTSLLSNQTTPMGY